ncbi:unnamed protein product [Mycena citricolor]|uniref:Uncharacterized protein n=1 Tax=Mycena citricolor TaxID=2018698 RepID=A0AAD2JYD0_9AGAR|nr:unnamed protein product [Mycena citricolor]
MTPPSSSSVATSGARATRISNSVSFFPQRSSPSSWLPVHKRRSSIIALPARLLERISPLAPASRARVVVFVHDPFNASPNSTSYFASEAEPHFHSKPIHSPAEIRRPAEAQQQSMPSHRTRAVSFASATPSPPPRAHSRPSLPPPPRSCTESVHMAAGPNFSVPRTDEDEPWDEPWFIPSSHDEDGEEDGNGVAAIDWRQFHINLLHRLK